MKELFKGDSLETKIEQVKQQIAEIQKIFDSTIQPQKNHKLFEVNLLTGKVLEAEFDEVPPIRWQDAVDKNYSRNRNVTRKENCLYISSLNVKNVIKILKRDFNITLTIINN